MGGEMLTTPPTIEVGSSETARPEPSDPTLDPKPNLRIGARAAVQRVGLLDYLEASSSTPVVAIFAPPGYGKTTLLAQWAERDPRPFEWLTIDQQHNDPAVLLRSLAVALNRVEPIARPLLSALESPGPLIVETVLPQLGSALAARVQPAVLILDDVHVLQSWDCLEAVAALIGYLPPGSQVAIASRSEPPLPFARLRAEGRVVELGTDDLAMDHQEAGSLLENTEVDASHVEVAELVRRTEGWPVALHFASHSLRSRSGASAALAGHDRFLADYLQVTVLSHLPSRLVSFLRRAAVLDRMCGPLCDAVLGMTGSADLLESLERSNLLVIPLDRRRQWYRFHPLFRELLRAQLERREPRLASELTGRAAEWYERNQLPETAIEYAMAAGDVDRAARLVVDVALPMYHLGRDAVLQRWFDWFESGGWIDRSRHLAVLGAWLSALAGHPAAAERWADAAARGPFEDPLPDGSASTDGWMALLRAALCRDGPERMHHDAETALALVPTGSMWRPTVHLLLGISHLLAGDLDSADRELADAAELGEDAGVDTATVALAERSLVAIARGEWQRAETLAERAHSTSRTVCLEQNVTSILLHAVSARLAMHRGEIPSAREHLARAERLRPRLSYVLPYYAVQAQLELARGYRALTDAAAAIEMLWEIDDVLLRRPDLGILGQQADELRTQLNAMRDDAIGLSSLTAAEVRLFRVLGTHYSFREIAGQLYLSQHTVKSQAMSIYRKFGVSSRSQAIQRGRDLGLLGDGSQDPFPGPRPDSAPLDNLKDQPILRAGPSLPVARAR
jgi:LuxR family transcriptional regulator, maltose regulon positive regulatory protein